MGHLLVAGIPENDEKSAAFKQSFLQKHRRGVVMAGAFVVGSAVVTTLLAGTLYLFG